MSSGLQVCCAASFGHVCGANDWHASPVSSHDVSSVTLDTSACTGQAHVVAAVRYAWSESPCDFMKCAVYSRDNDLPGPPFIEHAPFQTRSDIIWKSGLMASVITLTLLGG